MKDLHNSLTFRLFKKNDTSPFIGGMASILDVSDPDHIYNYDKTDAEADANSIHSDWAQVGRDLRSSMLEYASRKTAG